MSVSPKLSLPFIMPAQAQKHVTHNEAIQILDVLVQMRIAELDLAEPPLDAAEGLVVTVGAGSGAFAGQDGKLACRLGGGWVFLPPHDGFTAWVESEQSVRVYSGGIWKAVSGPGSGGPIDGIGINATWDAVNRFSVASPATLLSHEGGDHRVTVNKAGETDTASLLFSDGFTARAEMGLAGNDDFSIKVSADGETWATALAVEAASGTTTLGVIESSEIRGEAVQAAPDDVTPGRLMRADWGYGPGNLLGRVSHSMGAPTGAVIERGETAQGSYLRLADGTQVCAITGFPTAANAPAFWTFPLPFATDVNLWIGITSSYAGGPRVFARDSATTSQVGIRSWNVAGSESVTPACDVIAIGRWF